MLVDHLPQYSVKPSNESKTVTRTLKYVVLVVSAICVVIVSALFIRLLLIPTEAFRNPSTYDKIESQEELIPVQQGDEQTYVINVNLGLDRQNLDSITAEPLPENSTEQIENKGAVLRKEHVNTQSYPSTPTAKPCLLSVLNGDSNRIYLEAKKTNKSQQKDQLKLGNPSLLNLSESEHKNKIHNSSQSTILFKVFPRLNSQEFFSESNESHVESSNIKQGFIPNVFQKLFFPDHLPHKLIISPPDSNENQSKSAKTPRVPFIDQVTNVKIFLPDQNGSNESELSSFHPLVDERDFQFESNPMKNLFNTNEFEINPYLDNPFFAPSDFSFPLPDLFFNLENTINPFGQHPVETQLSEPYLEFENTKSGINVVPNDNVRENDDAVPTANAQDNINSFFDGVSSNFFNLFQ